MPVAVVSDDGREDPRATGAGARWPRTSAYRPAWPKPPRRLTPAWDRPDQRFQAVEYTAGRPQGTRSCSPRPARHGMVLVGRPYNMYDGGVSARRLREEVARALRRKRASRLTRLPLDPASTALKINSDNMYWSYGQQNPGGRHNSLARHLKSATSFMSPTSSAVRTLILKSYIRRRVRQAVPDPAIRRALERRRHADAV